MSSETAMISQPSETVAPASQPITSTQPTEIVNVPTATESKTTPVDSNAKAKIKSKRVVKTVSRVKSSKSSSARRAHPAREQQAYIRAPAIKRLARRGGVKRMSLDTYEEIRNIASKYVRDILQNALVVTRHAGRKTVTAKDIVFSIQQSGHSVYGV